MARTGKKEGKRTEGSVGEGGNIANIRTRKGGKKKVRGIGRGDRTTERGNHNAGGKGRRTQPGATRQALGYIWKTMMVGGLPGKE